MTLLLLLPLFQNVSLMMKNNRFFRISCSVECRENKGYDHSTLQRWVRRFTGLIDKRVRARKKPVNGSWRMDETYIKLNGKWIYLYRAVDKEGNTIDFLLRAKRDAVAAKAFFRKAFKQHGRPDKVTVDKSGSNKAVLDVCNQGIEEDKTDLARF